MESSEWVLQELGLLSYSWKKRKSPCCLLSLSADFADFPRSCRHWEFGFNFSLSGGSAKEGGSVYPTTIKGVQSPACCPENTLQLALSTLHPCSRLVPRNHLTLYPFDQSARCTEWEQISPTVLPPCWLGSCAFQVPLPSMLHFAF